MRTLFCRIMSSIEPYSFEPRHERPDSQYSDDFLPSILDQSSVSSVTDINTVDRLSFRAWCTCYRCHIMPSERECRCCREENALDWKMYGLQCITDHKNFEAVCLNVDVLRKAVVSMNDVRRGDITEPLSNRYAAV